MEEEQFKEPEAEETTINTQCSSSSLQSVLGIFSDSQLRQSHLDGAYYGPSIPSSQSYNNPARRYSRGICRDRSLCLFFKIIFPVIVALGVLVLIYALTFRLSIVKFHVANASSTQFNFTSNNILYYNLSLDINVRNPSKQIGIHYDSIEARAFYEYKRFSSVTLSPFFQRCKNTTVLRPIFQGQALVPLADSELSVFNRDQSDGTFDIEVNLYLRIWFKFHRFESRASQAKVKCDFKVPLVSDGTVLVSRFQIKKCKIK